MPKIYFSLKVTLVCGFLIIGMLRLSFWQWQRHGEKQEYINELSRRIKAEITPLSAALPQIIPSPERALFFRYAFAGDFDFEHEVVIQNRRLGELPGVYVITPLKLADSDHYILVNRGFLPLPFSSAEERTKLRGPVRYAGLGLAKLGASGSLLAPQDPSPESGEWFDTWLRIDIPRIEKQLPYKILPIYLELLSSETPPDIDKEVIASGSARNDIFFMASRKALPTREDAMKLNLTAPVPVISTIIPPSRHLGYVFEWAIMALMTALIGLVLQMRPRRN